MSLTMCPTQDSLSSGESSAIPEAILRLGYAIAPACSFAFISVLQESFEAFRKNWDSLVLDEYLPQSYGTRYRRHGRFLYDPSGDGFQIMPSGSYLQTRDANILMGGIRRTFAPLQPSSLDNQFFGTLLAYNVNQLRLSSQSRWMINVHFVRIPSTPDQAGYPCPEGIHRDGFQLISIHLIKKSNIRGDLTTLYDINRRPLLSTTLELPLDSIYVDDGIILHYTDPFFSEEAGNGLRDMLLLSYHPMP